eukprot:scaffold101295_cov58-Attheya_sp.AAC.5
MMHRTIPQHMPQSNFGTHATSSFRYVNVADKSEPSRSARLGVKLCVVEIRRVPIILLPVLDLGVCASVWETLFGCPK